MSLAPPVLHALAQIRAAVRTHKGQDLGLLYQMLLGLSLYALTESLPVPIETAPLGQPQEASQAEPDEAMTAGQSARLSGWKRRAAPGERAGFSPRWFYDHADDLPFRIGGRGRTPVRFSRRGLCAWLSAN